MKISVGYAKYEAFELIFGNVLVGIGGFLVGLAYSNQDLVWLIYPACAIFGFGIIFDVRVLQRFAYELTLVKNDITKAQTDLSNTTRDLETTKVEVKREENNLQKTMTQLRQTKTELDITERKMKKTEEMIFGSGGSTFSHASWARPLEREIETLKKKVEDLQRKMDSIYRGR